MNLKNLDKNLIGNIVILVSLILVIICIFMILTSSVTDTINASQVEWNGYKYYLESDSQVEENTEDTLKITSPFGTHNIELRKTTDQTTFKEHFGPDLVIFSEYDFNETHKCLSDEVNYMVLVPKDAVEMNGAQHVIKENTEFIEVIGEDPMYMSSFISSFEKVK